MKKLSKQKQQQLVLVVLGTAIVLAAVWFGLISTQQSTLRQLASQKAAVAKKLEAVRHEMLKAESVDVQLTDAQHKLARIEEGMATGDLYSWTINTIRQFKLPYKVEIPQFSQIDGPKECNQLYNFPYKQASLSVGGSAYYYEFGRFVADFENQFPYMRIMNLTLEPESAQGSDREKLSFRMELMTLVKPSAS